MSVTELADRLPLSISATRDRLRRLESTGVIEGFGVRVNPAALGRTIDALIDVRLGSEVTVEAFEAHVRPLPAVIDGMHITGRFDCQLHVVARDVAELDDLLMSIKERLGAEETNTRLVLRNLDNFPRPPIELVE